MAFMHEREGRAKARELVTRTGYGKSGGHFKKGGAAGSDHAEDVRMIRSAINQHDSQLHGGAKTRLKLADGGSAEGPMSEGRSDRSPRGKGHGKKHATTNVNVIVAGSRGQGQPTPMPVPMPAPHPPMAGPPAPPLGGPPPGAMPPPGGMPPGPMAAAAPPPRPPMPMPPPGAMPPGGMPMRKAGGRAGYKPPHMTAGTDSGEGRLERSRGH